jgi:hypothetical protein
MTTVFHNKSGRKLWSHLAPKYSEDRNDPVAFLLQKQTIGHPRNAMTCSRSFVLYNKMVL